MEFVMADHKVAMIRTEGYITPRKVRIGNHMIFWTTTHAKGSLAEILVDAVVNAKGSLSADIEDNVKRQRICQLADAKFIDALIVTNKSYTRKYEHNKEEGLIHFVRYADLTTVLYIDGKPSARTDSPSIYMRDDSKRVVLSGIPRPIEALPHLKTAGMLMDYEIVELPWVDRFRFSQPDICELPHDIR